MKTFILKLQIPKKYKWLAQMPWGDWLAFEKKPFVDPEMGEMGAWGSNGDELYITNMDILNELGEKAKNPNWKETLQKI